MQGGTGTLMLIRRAKQRPASSAGVRVAHDSGARFLSPVGLLTQAWQLAGRQEPLGVCRRLRALNYPACPSSRIGSHLPKVVTGVVLENAFGGLEGGRGHRSWGPDFFPSLHPYSPKHTWVIGPVEGRTS